MQPVICIIDYDEDTIQLFNSDTLPVDDCLTNVDNGDELYIRDDLHCAFFEDKDNSDEYEEDDDEYYKWIYIELPCDNDRHDIQNYTDEDVHTILSRFKFLKLITIENGRATICE